jgi:hypothetical protein
VSVETGRAGWKVYQIDEIPLEAVAPDARLSSTKVRELAELYFADKLMRPWEELRAAGFEVWVGEDTSD